MKPEVTIIANDSIDEKFAKIAQEIIQREFDRVPDDVWLSAYRDIIVFGEIHDATKSRIRRLLGIPDTED